ncbi:MAG: TIGR00730 family Rossman fold protein [bacterium]|nr:TIGR00730 family Rossman fold protein [bacterium]
MKRVCVYLGSNPGRRPEYADMARALAQALAVRETDLVYGGSKRGLMKVLADTMLNAGRGVVGVIPRFMADLDVQHDGLTELHVVDTMHERKALMVDLADGFIALPGGFGTFEELFEALAWQQLELHAKPCGLLNVCGYFDALNAFLDHAVSEHLLMREHRDAVLCADDPDALIDLMTAYRAPATPKWVEG